MKLIKIAHDHFELDGIKITDKLSEVKKLIGEVDVDKKAEKFIGCEYDDIEDSIDQIGYDSFIRGYNQALEDNKERYKEIIELIKNITEWSSYKDHPIGKQAQKALELLQPKTEWEVEFIEGKLKLKQ